MFSNKLLDVRKEVIELPNEVPDTPMVSVCVPTYQHAKYIKSCLDSILMQECTFPFEVIVGEDESTDGTREICLEYAKNEPGKIRLFLHSRENNIIIDGHPTGRFNFLYSLSKARGKYVALCEGDDYWTDPHKLQKQVDFLEANDSFAICHHNLQVEYEDDVQEHHLSRLSNYPNQKEVTGIEDLAFGNYIFTASCMFRNNLFKRFPEWLCNTPVGDYVLHMLNAQFGKIKYFSDVMGVYRVHKNGLWESKAATYRDEQWVRMLDQMSNFFKPHIKQGLINAQNNLLINLINHSSEDGTKREYYSGKLLENKAYLFRASVRKRRGSGLPKVSIVLPLSKDLELTIQCLNSIYENTSPELFELILVQRDPSVESNDFAFELERKFDNVTVYPTFEKLTFAEACNRGIRQSDADFTLLLKHNLEVTPGWLEAMLSEAGKDENVGIVGSCVIYKGTSVIRHAGVKIANCNGLLTPLPVHRFRVIDSVEGARASKDMQALSNDCMLIKRELIKSLVELDEEFPENYQGIDLCLRAGRAGFRVRYCPNSVICYVGPEIEGINESSDSCLDRLNQKWVRKVNVDLTEQEAHAELDEIRFRQSLLEKSEQAARENLIRTSNRKLNEEFKLFLASILAIQSGMKQTSQYRGVLPFGDARFSANAAMVSQFELVGNIEGIIARAEELMSAKKYEEAEETLKVISLAVPYSIDALNDLAVVEFLEGKFEEALKSLRQVLTLDPVNKVANENIRLVLGKVSGVAKGGKPVDREGPAFGDGKSLERAESLIQQRQYEEAEMLLREILVESPSNVEVLNDLAIICSLEGEPEKAIDLLSNVASRDPSNTIALKNLGKLYIELNRLEDGLKSYLKALESAPTDSEAILMIAEICRVLGRTNESYPFYKRALELDPENEVARAGLQTVNKRNLKTDPSTELYSRAQTMITEGDHDHALTTLLEVVAISPNHADAHNDLAVLYHQAGDLNRAASHLERSVELNPEDTVAAKNLAILYSITGRYEKALAIFQQLLGKDPGDVRIFLAVSDICVKLNRPADAKLVLEGALSLTNSEQLRNQILSTISEIDKQIGAGLAAAVQKDSNPDMGVDLVDPTVPTSNKMVSIIIPVFNKVEFTKGCLQSILDKVHYQNYEVVVVDNASTDGTPNFMEELVSEFKQVRYIRNEANLGFVDACNVGVDKAKGDYVLLLNNDTLVNDDWLESLVDFAERTPDCGAVGSKLIFPDGRLQEAGGITFSDANGWNYGRGASPNSPKFNFVREVDYISGASLMVRKDLWKSVGGLDRRYAPAYYEDTDLCFAIRSLGYKVYFQPRSSILHFEGVTSGTNLQEGFKRYQIINRPKFMGKWKKELVSQYRNDPANVEKASSRGVKGRILVIDPTLPMYDRASGSLRTFHLLKTLKNIGLHVTYIATNMGLSNIYKPMLEQMGIETYAGDRDAMAYLGQESKAPRIDYESLLHERQFDYALIDFWYEAEYYLPIIRRSSPLTQIIIDTVDVHWLREFREAQLQNDENAVQRAAEKKQREISIYKQADRLWVVTPTDEDEIRKYVPDVPTDVVSNVHDNVDVNTEFDSTSDILFVGNFNHLPNRDAVRYFAKDIWPVIREALPNVKFYVVGNNPSDDVRALASDNVIVTGHVKDLTPYWQSARLSVVPLRYGAGMKGKLGDALSHGVPTVSTSVGIEGMSLVDGEEVLVADEPAAFAESVVSLYTDRELWEKLSVGGKAKIERLYSPSQIRARLESVFHQLVTRGASKTSGLTSIVILTYNQLEFTKITIDSIRRHTKTPYEIIVVDNASTDSTVEYLKTQKDVRTIFNEENVGFPAGCNQGMEIAKGDYILLLNNDVIVTDDWLEGLIECSGADPEVGIVGPRTNWISGYQLEAEITYKKVSQVPSFAARYRRKNRRKWIEVPRVAGFCMLIKREVLEKIGGLDTLFGIGNCEDDDFCLRSKLSGFKVALAGDVFIHHFGSKSFNQKGMEKYLDTVRAKEKLFEDKWGVDPAGWWRDGKAPTKSPLLYVPLTAGEPIPVSQ